ncbi:Sorting nexin, cytoplasm-to-vacuole targeting pathway/endosomal sorting [Basidiobolus ranarum]|uniref:Sorting nexin, cytoplasm-to-vacuole targeting pathway/endosomal sorting n=1 Tax=Basidiobolus ranarum TaxID=34480 RepID=A0ABR2X5L6_9FUNG
MEYSDCCCKIEYAFRRNSFKIIGSQKASDNGGSPYVTYVINFGNFEVRRRYSEFESLRNALCKLHPSCIVPPIPRKHSIAHYATMQNRKDDILMVEKRKRLLQSFLNRVAEHTILSEDHVFHRFLENVSWAEVLHSPPLSNIPKNLLQTPPSPVVASQSQASPSPLPTPSSLQQLKKPDPRFLECELYTNKFSNHITALEKTQKRVTKKLGDLANDFAELGAVFNGFSLNETDSLANAIERIGQAVDATFMSTGSMVTTLECEFSEPLQEYVQFSSIIKKLLKYRYLKHLQLETTSDSLANKRIYLNELELAEQESKRLEEALKKTALLDEEDLINAPLGTTPPTANEPDITNYEVDQTTSIEGNTFGSPRPTPPSSAASVISSASGTPSSSRKKSSTSFLNRLSYTIHGIMDVDPEATRRNNIGRTREQITLLEEQLEMINAELADISTNIQIDLDRFQKRKELDLRDMLLAYAKAQVKWCKKNLEPWEEAQEEVNRICD